MSLDDADQLVRTSIANRLHMMTEDGKELHKILRDSSEALKTTKGVEGTPYMHHKVVTQLAESGP